MYDYLKQQLIKHQIPFAENISLDKFTTFRLGGPCPILIRAASSDQLKTIVHILNENNFDFFVFGRGSNVLVSDQGIACPVIHTQIDTPQIQRDDMYLRIFAGTALDDVATFAMEHDLKGINFTSGIPGTIGGAVVGNAGAFGHQIGEAVIEAELITKAGKSMLLKATDLKFAYRDSILKHTDDTLLSTTLKLSAGNHAELQAERAKIMETRRQKHVDYHKVPCAGSFFKNIVKPNGERESAGSLLEECGCKELTYGDAAVYHGHANIIINKGRACAKDIVMLSRMMQKRVFEKNGIRLEPEVRLIGKFD